MRRATRTILAVETRRGMGPRRDVFAAPGLAGSGPWTLDAPARLRLLSLAAGDDDGVEAATRWLARPEAALPAERPPEAERGDCLRLEVDPAGPAVEASLCRREAEGSRPLHYLRLADATTQPLPADPGRLVLAAGDAYVAVSAGARRVADGPAVARFIHVRDDFNAPRLARALLDHLAEGAGGGALPEDITVVVVEAR